MSIVDKYADHFLPAYSNYPQARYISLLLVRRVESEAIFRTEGSGEPLSKEFIHAGGSGEEVIQRVVISKRKGYANATFTVRKVSYGVGVERIFPLHSPIIQKIEVITRGRVRRAKIYYLRKLRGKAARIKERRLN